MHIPISGGGRGEGRSINPWQRWLSSVTNDASARGISRRIGVHHTTVGRWMNAGVAAPDDIIRIARAYRADALEGLIAAGWITDVDLMNGLLRNAVRRAPTVFLTEELHDRAQAGRVSGER